MKKRNLQSLLILSFLAYGLICTSCGEEADTSTKEGSVLMQKINAVQEQIMAQGNMTKEEEQAISSLCSILSQNDGLAVHTSDSNMLLKEVEVAPVFKGCEQLSAEATRSCFEKEVGAFIQKEFDRELLKDLALTENKEVDVFFIITEQGDLKGIKVRQSDVNIQAEILRILRKMPKMQAAMHKGEAVSVLCSMVVSYGKDIDVTFKYIPERPEN